MFCILLQFIGSCIYPTLFSHMITHFILLFNGLFIYIVLAILAFQPIRPNTCDSFSFFAEIFEQTK